MRRVFFLALVIAFAFMPLAIAQVGARDSRLVLRDPPPLVEKTQWVFELRWDSGDVYLIGVRKVDMAAPFATPRVMGRFAIELTERGTLVERTRFDFPGLAVPDDDGGIRMTAKIRTRIGVFFPATSRGDKIELVDRTTQQRWALPWPPQQPVDASQEGG